ncbi:MAG: UDP-N-acetylmuramate--L-alanine ligase, partial [Actinomycetota bacterium]|nr:UDP-N-acetylmuramate--L-alanine ligase [Actinomycetota bacterium]
TYTGHHPEVVSTVDLVVASSAVPDRDPELVAAATAGIPVWRRPRLLQDLTALLPTIGATGTHGKTTTTALLIAGLRAAGVDPSFIVGGDLADLGTNGHYGQDRLLVLEADEAFRTFESLQMVGLVVTNVESEHVEHFGSPVELLETFVAVASAVKGPVVACVDDSGAAQVAERTGAITYGLDASAMWRVRDFTPHQGGSSFTLSGPAKTVEVHLRRPGLHNARNAAGALALLETLGHDLGACADGMAGFHGVGRRWEHRGVVAGVTLIDDYAHHPTEVAATLSASVGVVPGRVWAVFQPHLYSRTERLQDEFGEALSAADVVVVTDVYGSREEPVPGVTGDLVAEAVRRRGREVHYVAHKADLARFLVDRVVSGDLVLTMGAGDITLLPTEVAAMLAESR